MSRQLPVPRLRSRPSGPSGPAKALLALLLATTTGVVALAGGSDLIGLQRPAEADGVAIVPDRFLRPWDPVTLFFPTAKGPADGGPEDAPEKYARLEPAHPGAWEWLDAKTLQFRPAEPWPALSVFSAGPVGGRGLDLFTLLAPPTETSPADGETGLGEVDDIVLTFARPLPAEALARMATIELRPLPGLEGDGVRVLDRDSFEVKVLDRTAPGDPARYALVLDRPIPLGTRATVRLGLALDRASESVATTTFSTAEPFRVRSFGCGSAMLPASPEGVDFAGDRPLVCDNGRREVWVDFTAAPAALGPVEARNLVRFDPAVPDLKFVASGNRLVVQGAFAADTSYQITLAPTSLRDVDGRPLDMSGPSTASLVYPRRDPYLEWAAGGSVLELRGPKVLPMVGRGHDRLDVRAVRVDPLDRGYWPFPEELSVDEDSRPPHPGEEPAPWTDPGRQSEWDLERQLRGLRTPGLSRIVDLPVPADGDAARFGLDLEPLLDELAGDGAPGHYLVGVRRLDGGSERRWRRVQVTDLSVTTVSTAEKVAFSVTSLATGLPVPGATVIVDGPETRAGQEEQRASFFQATTDAAGLAHWTAPGWEAGVNRTVDRVVVRKGADALVLDPVDPPEAFADGYWREGWGWLDWTFDPLDARLEPVVRLAHLYPDRPVYRPGDTVHLRGYVRDRHQGRLSSVTGAGHVVLDGPGGEQYREPVELTGNGDLYATFDEEQPSSGTWTATFEDASGVTYGQTSFRIEAYRLPTFEIDLHGDEKVANDRPFDVKLTASYYAGGRVAGESVRWRVTQYPYDWEPSTLEGFAWSSDARFGRWSRFESTPALDREDRTDDSGAASLTLDPGVEPTAQPRTYVVEATVTGADAQTVTTTERYHAVPAFALGVSAPRWLETVTAIEPKIAVAGPDGKLLAGREVTVRLLEKKWNSHLQASDFSDGVARYVTDVTEVAVRETKVTSADRPVPVSLPIDHSGVWIVELEARDALGRAQTVRVDLYAGGRDAVSWEKPTAGTFQLTADKPSHQPGELAKILLRSPFQQAEALVVVEAPTGNRYQRLAVRGGQATFQLPIEEGWTPNLPVHVVLMRGRKDGPLTPGANVDPGRPQTVAATLDLRIAPIENTVAVTVKAPEKARPGQTIPVTVKLAEPDGDPLAGELTLWLVDRAVLSLGAEQRLDPVPDFVPERESRAEVHDTRNRVLGRVPVEVMPGGDGEEEGEGLDSVSVRKNMKVVPFYRANIPVGANGEVTVQVPLPDNLTTFAIRAKATAGPQRFGAGKGAVAVRLPVVAQPALPRFVRPGDAFEAAAIARVVDGPVGAGKAEIKATGLSVRGAATRSFTFGTAASVLAFPVSVETPPLDAHGNLARSAVDVRIAAARTSDGAGDAFEVSLPLADDREPVVLRAITEVKGAAVLEALPEAARPGSVHRRVVVSTDPGILKLHAALDVLRKAPRHGTGTRLDAARGWLAIDAFRAQLGLGDDVRAEADAAVVDAARWLPDVVDGRGLVADWPGARGTVQRTADAALFLIEAKAQARPVDEALLSSLLDALKRSLRSDYAAFVDGESWYERTRALHALASAGTMEEAYWSELLRNSSLLGTDGASRVVLAAARVGSSERAGVPGLVDRLENEVSTRLVNGEEVYAGLKTQRTDRNPLIVPSEARTLAELARAVAATRPRSARLDLVVDALVSIGGQDGWGSTDADREALLALAEVLAKRPGEKRTVTFTAGGATKTMTLGPAAVVVWEGADAGPVTVKVEGGAATAFTTTRFVPSAPGSEVTPAQAGYVVERGLSRIRATGPADQLTVAAAATVGLSLGDVVEDTVRVTVPEARHYVAITVPLAAGLEPLNPGLATAPPEATPSAGPTREPTATVWRDDQVTYYYDALPKGTYELRFRARATTAGRFVQPPARAESIYALGVRGHSAGTAVEVSIPR